MKFVRTSLISISLILALLPLIFPVSSLETDILLMTGHNLSIGLEQEFVLSKFVNTTEKGVFYQTINLANSTNSEENAVLALYSIPMYSEEQNMTNSSAFSKFLENTMIGGFQLIGGKVESEVSVKNTWQRNVTVYSISIPKSKEKPNGEKFIFAVWPIDSRNMMMLISYLDPNVTTKIVETLEVKS
jgi:hypothetical protein